MTSPGADPRRDQEAAQLRDWHERTGFSAAPLNRQEMEALIERSATSDEIQAWLQAQIDQHIAEAEAIRALETGETDERTTP